ncbi:MAG: type I restriction endonuclease subunit R [Chloroflexi bacterium AL-W]|nr:type I restriction endonuclease subunit R [Chloroflexi bacterium AL-N1]NOK66382.1 type I restriction endonuclease subunit R [Chloroflexi bacterium AL-N10]NOK71770.1 type I restriction endonuclease subunit R [Chloroflexi bacterium AL-N5]NOK81027.1 type I restriction endonuclease subunit R [Chloroflexi bacterium AL-W]NOK89300.1 type I restriction endonuclease subunit R [Chloroflexi bacterium AL-N15]
MMNEALLEDWTLTLFREVGYTHITGAELGANSASAERDNYNDVVLTQRLRSAIERLNPDFPQDALDDALYQVTHPDSASLVTNNHNFHRMLVEGVPVSFRRPDGHIDHKQVHLVNYHNPLANDWLVVNQLTIRATGQLRRPDVIIFVNGLPLAVVELKNPTDADTTTREAYNQLQRYKETIPDLFVYNSVLVTSDGVDARIGSLTANFERFLPWRTIEGKDPAPTTMPELQVLIFGAFEKHRFLDLIRYFTVFEDDGGQLAKKIAGYHQFHAVNAAIEATIAATNVDGDGKCGVVWHTQGSGKSLTMVFYTGRLVIHEVFKNPTIVVLTDRNDLDNQLFGVFARCYELLRQIPQQADNRDHLRELLSVKVGGIVFTTIQKFLPPENGTAATLSERHNIIVIADEAHRSQYGLETKFDAKTGEFTHGFARRVRDALPNASFLGFTGTPIEKTDRNTRQVFGDYISIYDIQRAVDDGATVPIHYENRITNLDIDEEQRPHLDPDFEEVTEGEDIAQKESLKSKWTALEAIVGTEKRLALIAQDLITHFEQRQETLDGKAMIVCMSRRICVDFYQQLIKLHPDWHGDNDDQGTLKIIMTGSSADPNDWQQHIRTKARREKLAYRFRDPDTTFKLVIVRDMWLTGFDAPSLHTMYIDKPMRGHGLMQAIARVNRVFRDKPSGLIVDYLGLTNQLQQALRDYTDSGGQGEPTTNQDKAVADMQKYYEICCDLFHGFDWSVWTDGLPGERLSLLPAAQEHIFDQEDGMARLNQVVKDLSEKHAAAMPAPEALAIRDDVAFFQAVHTAIAKTTASGRAVSDEDLDHAVRQIVSRAIAPETIADMSAIVGISKDISILSDEFLEDVRQMPHKRLAVEFMNRVLKDELKESARTNVVQSRTFSAMLERSLRSYRNRAIATAQVVEELIELAQDIRAAKQRGEELGLSEEELAFYAALEVNDSAVKVLGDEVLKTIARELTKSVRGNARVDWQYRDAVRAKMRRDVRRLLFKHGYPPDKQDAATETVIEQAELLSDKWTR